MRWWTWRQWSVVALTAGATVFLLGVPTDLVDTPLFGRAVPPTPWAWPALLVTAVLSGLLAATYVAGGPTRSGDSEDGVKAGLAAEVLTFFAVGCPVCNKLALVALGTTGAIRWFAPVQPLLAVAGVALLAWALRTRLASTAACAVATTLPTDDDGGPRRHPYRVP